MPISQHWTWWNLTAWGYASSKSRVWMSQTGSSWVTQILRPGDWTVFKWMEWNKWAGEKKSLTDEEAEKLAVLKHKFNLVISADYKMSKLVPYWGLSPQTGSTYYLQKLSHDILGIVNHATGLSTVYLFDDTVDPKNTVSYITHFLGVLPNWIRCIHLFLDNTCSTNKNFYCMAWAWACEMVQQGRCDFLRI